MANTSEIRARREILAQEVERFTGLKMKRASYATTTGGLSCSNESMLLNGFAHLLCNSKNFQTVQWLLRYEIAIPPQFQKDFDRTSFLYACGTAPRIVRKGSRHISKDAVKTGLGQEFVCWAQAQRIAGVGGLAGLSRSVRAGEQFGAVDDMGNIVPTSEAEAARYKAANDQLAMAKVSELGQDTVNQVLRTMNKKKGGVMSIAEIVKDMLDTPVKAKKKSAPATAAAQVVELAD